MRKFLIVVMLCAVSLAAQDAKKSDKPADAKPEPEKPPARFVKQHRSRMGNADVAYTTTSEEIFLKDREGKSTASFFTVAYTKDGMRAEERPVTFIFNGGPGSASIWLHFGLVGPKVIDI